MALFGRKKAEKKQTAPVQNFNSLNSSNYEDIFNKPIKTKESSEKTEEAKEESLMGISPETVQRRMQALEDELAAKPPEKDYHYYDSNPVGSEEVLKAEQDFDKQYEIEHAAFLASHNQELSSINENDLAGKLEELGSENQRFAKEQSGNYHANQVSSEELGEIMKDFDTTRMSNMAIPVENEIAGISGEELGEIMKDFDTTRMSNMAIPVENEISGISIDDKKE